MDALDAAHQIVAEHFPTADAAFLAGGVLSTRRTSTSDLDIVVVLPGPPAPCRDTIEAHGWSVELFVHTRASLNYWWAKDAERRRCTLAHMCAHGTILSDAAGDATDIQIHALAIVENGPPPVTTPEMERRRYFLTDLLDDFIGADDATETTFIVASLLIEASELALVARGRWLGGGKWLARNLEDTGDVAQSLAEGQSRYVRDAAKEPLIGAVRAVLDVAGGPLRTGYREVDAGFAGAAVITDSWRAAAARGVIGLGDHEVRLLEYQPEWAPLFESFRDVLLDQLPEARIEHVGSTSMPGRLAKPLIDLSIGLAAGASFHVDQIRTFGLTFRSVNPESTLFALYGDRDRRLANLHVRVLGSTHERWDLLFRDYLRANPIVGTHYDDVKRRAASVTTERAAYSQEKGVFIAALAPEVEQWALDVQWRIPPSP